MTRHDASVPLHPVIREEASEWLVAFCEGQVDAAGRQAFDRWLRASPEHVRAYLRISALWESADLLAKGRRVDADELVKRASADYNVVVLGRIESGSDVDAALRASEARSKAHVRTRRHVAVAACLVLFCAMGAGALYWWQLPPRYVTGPAEQRIVQLSDGSTIQLNAQSRVEIHFSAAERGIDLIEGQALFSVARNSARPFVVRSNGTQIRAVGTQFDVYRKRRGTTVTVVEGRVAIVGPTPRLGSLPSTTEVSNQADTPVFVTAGEQAIVTSLEPARASRADVAAATAWTRGELVFQATPLRDVVEELNRTSSRHLVIEDATLLNYHVSGVFPYADPAGLNGFLKQRFGVVVEETDHEIHVRRRQPQ
jgi:transmembrane sensor